MATHSNILAWRIPWTEEPGGLQFMGPQRVGHDWATNTHTHQYQILDAENTVAQFPSWGASHPVQPTSFTEDEEGRSECFSCQLWKVTLPTRQNPRTELHWELQGKSERQGGPRKALDLPSWDKEGQPLANSASLPQWHSLWTSVSSSVKRVT